MNTDKNTGPEISRKAKVCHDVTQLSDADVRRVESFVGGLMFKAQAKGKRS